MPAGSAVALALAAAAAAWWVSRRGGVADAPPPGAAAVPPEIGPPPPGPLVGDPRHGARLFAIHCASCHGAGGAGDGPSAAVLRPSPRDLTDPVAMASRSDGDLVRLVEKGGPELGLSRLMPPFGDLLDRLAAWDVVAFLRTLHEPRDRVLPVPGPVARATVVLGDAGTRELAGAIGEPPAASERRVDLLLAGDPERPSAAAASPVLAGGRRAVVTVALDPAARPIAATARPAGAAGAPEAAAARKRLEARAAAALRQRAQDLGEAHATADRAARGGDALPRGQKLYLDHCAACHGQTGRGVGPNLATGDWRAANLADPARQTEVSDERLRRLIREGGRPLGSSPSMPAVDLPDADLEALVAYVRQLGVPAPTTGCLCGVSGEPCAAAAAGTCTCTHGTPCPAIPRKEKEEK
ncbi:MAG: cytochrome c [Planctomycetales bacterium]|nr:cytochrome c [Planctomycetales bacterium]